MRHLVIGASGQVGEALLKILNKRNEEIIGTFNTTSLWGHNNQQKFLNNIPPGKLFKLDITNRRDIERLVADIYPDIIYIPAAQTNVDFCEENPAESYNVNVGGIHNIVSAINNVSKAYNRRRRPLIVFYSSDYVFNGSAGPYSEKDLPSSINVYGRQKIDAEHILATQGQYYVIIRTCGVFGPEIVEKNFVNRLINNLNNDKVIIVPDDEIVTPTYSLDLADATLRLIDNIGASLRTKTSQIVNIAGTEAVSKYQFALAIAKIFNLNTELVKPIKSSEISRAARRPLLSGLKTDLAESMIGRKLVSYLDALGEMKRSIEYR